MVKRGRGEEVGGEGKEEGEDEERGNGDVDDGHNNDVPCDGVVVQDEDLNVPVHVVRDSGETLVCAVGLLLATNPLKPICHEVYDANIYIVLVQDISQLVYYRYRHHQTEQKKCILYSLYTSVQYILDQLYCIYV